MVHSGFVRFSACCENMEVRLVESFKDGSKIFIFIETVDNQM